MRKERTNSIRKTLRVTNIVIILAALVPFLINTLYYNFTLNQYERIIDNIYSANSLSNGLQDEIYITIWNVVAGKTRFGDNTQYELIASIKSRLDGLEKNAKSEDDSYLITVARNTLDTIKSYVDKIGDNIANSRPVRDNEEILGEKVYTSLADIPQKVDMINIFRKPNALDAIADAAIARGDVKVFWSQKGIVNNAAAQKAEDAGMTVVQNRCSMVEHRKLIG